jgi:hypothetical protein
MEIPDNETASSRYSVLETKRQKFLKRAYECSRLTIPFLLPENKDEDLPTPYQSIGSRGLNNIVSKLIITLLPPNQPFFKLMVDDNTIEELGVSRSDVEESLSKIERAVTQDFEALATRVPYYEVLMHLICSGNRLTFEEEGKTQSFSLDQYVVNRDPKGNILEIIVKEEISRVALPDDIKEKLKDMEDVNDDEYLELYTWIKREEKKYKVHQEVKGIIITGTEGSYKLDRLPWNPRRLFRVAGEDYGRGLVEQYLGDLISLEGLTQSIVEGSIAMAKMLIFCNPNGSTRIEDITRAANGDVIAGNREDVDVLQMDKFADFRVALSLIDRLTDRLEAAFLLNSSVQRNAERVTAEEIRFMASELETAHGGLYSILSQELQLEQVEVRMRSLADKGKLPRLPKEKVKPVIITGFDALGRGNDVQRHRAFLADLSALKEQGISWLNIAEYIKRIGTGHGIDMEGLIKTIEQYKQEQEELRKQQLIETIVPGAVKAGTDIAKESSSTNGKEEQRTR